MTGENRNESERIKQLSGKREEQVHEHVLWSITKGPGEVHTELCVTLYLHRIE